MWYAQSTVVIVIGKGCLRAGLAWANLNLPSEEAHAFQLLCMSDGKYKYTEALFMVQSIQVAALDGIICPNNTD